MRKPPDTKPPARTVHITYSREDAELLRQATNVVTRAGYQPTVELWGQGSAWFETWRKQLFEADGVVVLFTTGDEGGEAPDSTLEADEASTSCSKSM